MAADIVGLDLLVQQHMTHNGTEYKLFLDAGYPVGKFCTYWAYPVTVTCLFVGVHSVNIWLSTHSINSCLKVFDSFPLAGRSTITPFRRVQGQSDEELEWNRFSVSHLFRNILAWTYLKGKCADRGLLLNGDLEFWKTLSRCWHLR